MLSMVGPPTIRIGLLQFSPATACLARGVGLRGRFLRGSAPGPKPRSGMKGAPELSMLTLIRRIFIGWLLMKLVRRFTNSGATSRARAR